MKNIKKIAAAIFVVVLLISSSAVTASAQVSSVVVKNFGGPIISFVLPTPLCPVAHTVIFDYGSNMTIGIATVFTTRVYQRGNLITPSRFVLGSATRTPIPCAVPYPVYPIIEVGTS